MEDDTVVVSVLRVSTEVLDGLGSRIGEETEVLEGANERGKDAREVRVSERLISGRV